MKRRLTRAILLLYPRRVREGHGPEITALIDDLITHEARSRTRLLIRLTVDGLVQRTASTATIWTVTAVLTATGLGGLAVSDFAAANALPRAPHGAGPARRTDKTCAILSLALLVTPTQGGHPFDARVRDSAADANCPV